MLQRHLLIRMPHDLLGELGERIGLVEVAVGRIGDVGVANRPAAALRPPRHRRSPRPVPTRSRARASPRSWQAPHRPQPTACICALTCCGLALRQSSGTNGLRVPSLPGGYLASLEMLLMAALVVEALAHLVDRDRVLPSGVADVECPWRARTGTRVAGEDAADRIARAEHAADRRRAGASAGSSASCRRGWRRSSCRR